MTEEKQNNPIQQPQPYPIQQAWYPPPEDEINLIDLWNILWDRKWMIILITTVITIGAVVYSLLATPVYQAEVFFLPPQAKDIQPLNVNIKGAQGVQGVTVIGVYEKFKMNLNSRRVQRRYFDDKGLREHYVTGDEELSDEDILEEFQKIFALNIDQKDKNILSFTVDWGDPEIAAQIANEVSELAAKVTVAQLASGVRNKVKNRIKEIEYAISSKRKMAKMRREDSIARLEEAMKIASSLGQIERIESSNVVQQSNIMAGGVSDAANTPLYYRGKRSLEAEVAILKNRKSDDPFIMRLRDLQEELALLRAVKIDERDLRSVTVDRKAYPPKYRIKPKRKLIVALGGVVGLMIGIFAAFLMNFIVTQRKEESVDIP